MQMSADDGPFSDERQFSAEVLGTVNKVAWGHGSNVLQTPNPVFASPYKSGNAIIIFKKINTI